MTIGLDVKQIRKLSKRAYSDRQMVKTVPKATGDIIKSGDLWWSNGCIVLFESAPDAPEKYKSAAEKVRYAKGIGEWVSQCSVQVFPVEVRPHLERRIIRFENANGDRVSIDAKYVSAMLATKRVGKKRDPGVRWYMNTDPAMPALLAVNGRNIGLVAGTVELDETPEWNFRYTGELPS